MTGRPDDWDDPASPAAGGERQPPSGHIDADEPRARPVEPPAPTVAGVFALAAAHVDEFCRRPEVDLDLPEAMSACLHLVRQTGFLAMASMTRDRERAENQGWSPVAGSDLREEFGSHIEEAMAQHRDLVLGTWLEASRDRRGRRRSG